MEMKEMCRIVIGAAMRVHSHFGPGFLEEVYKNALLHELRKVGLNCEKEVGVDVMYDGVRVGYYQADIIVDNRLILELKAVSTLVAKHEAQIVNYLSATGIDDGLLLNFGSQSLQFKHKYRLPKILNNPVNPVNPVRNNYGDKKFSCAYFITIVLTVLSPLSQKREEHAGAGQGVIKGVMAVYGINAQNVDKMRERMAFQIGPPITSERERVADLHTLRRKLEIEFGALLPQHPQIERRIVRDQQRVFADKREELPHRRFRRDAILAQKIERNTMHPFRIRIHLTCRADVERERARQLPAHIFSGGDLADLVVVGATGRLGIEHDHPPAPRIFRNPRQCIRTDSHIRLCIIPSFVSSVSIHGLLLPAFSVLRLLS